MKARTCCGVAGAGKWTRGSRRRGRRKESSAVNGISSGAPSAAGTFHRRPLAPYTIQRPSGVQRARVGVTSACPVSRTGAALGESTAIVHTCHRSAESRAKNPIRRPSGANAGASAAMALAVSGVARPVARSTSQRRPPPSPRAESATTARWRPSGAHAGSRRSGPASALTVSSCVSPPAGSIQAIRLRQLREALSGGSSRVKAIVRPSGDHAACVSRPSGSRSCVSCRGAAAPRSSSHSPVRPRRSPRKTMRRPSGDHEGSRSSAVSRTASVSGRAAPPPAGSSQSWPSRSMTRERPSEERSRPRVVPSWTRMLIASVGCGRVHAAARQARRTDTIAPRSGAMDASGQCSGSSKLPPDAQVASGSLYATTIRPPAR